MSKNKENKKLIKTIKRLKAGDELRIEDNEIVCIDDKNVLLIKNISIYELSKEELIKRLKL